MDAILRDDLRFLDLLQNETVMALRDSVYSLCYNC